MSVQTATVQPAGATGRVATTFIRALDLCLAAVTLIVVAPILLTIALAVRLDSKGPVLFRQARAGRNGQQFTVNKFRTMRTDADESVHRAYVEGLIHGQAERVSDGRRELYKLAVDDRVTPVGRFLRRWSLDELPQLLNVLIGDMSLVGPRPVIPYEVERYPSWYHERFAVKPGLTGLWQISGRNERTYEEMVELDIEFARAWSPSLYLRVLLRTPIVVLTRRGAA